MIKISEIIFLISCIAFIIYYNISDTIVSRDILGCTDSSAINYNPSATIDDTNCVYEDNLGDCYDETYPDPCICEWGKNTGQSCDFNASSNNLINLDAFDFIKGTEDIHFQKLVSSSSSEYYYKKLMEISWITYMDYVHTNLYRRDNINSRETPQFLFFLAIEFLKRQDYIKSKDYLNSFLKVYKQYEMNKFDREKTYFRSGGCCQADIAWLVNQDYKAYKIAKILKNIIIHLETDKINSKEILKEFDSLYEFDNTPNTIDLIDNIIFSVIHSTDNPILIEYFDNLLNKSESILFSSFDNEIFEGTAEEYYLTSQMDIMIFKRLKIAENKIFYLHGNNPKNSLNDMKALLRYAILYNIYIKNDDMIDTIYKSFIDEYDIINNQIIDNDNNSDVDFGIGLPPSPESDKFENDNSDAEKIPNDNINEADRLKDAWNVLISNEGQNILENNFFYNILKTKIDLIDYDYFITFIDKNNISQNLDFPIFKKDLFKKQMDPLQNISKEEQKQEYIIKYFEDNDSYPISIYNLDVYSLSLFRKLFYLGSNLHSFSNELVKTNNKIENSLTSYKLLYESIEVWKPFLKQ